jgi:hypothetical protein
VEITIFGNFRQFSAEKIGVFFLKAYVVVITIFGGKIAVFLEN